MKQKLVLLMVVLFVGCITESEPTLPAITTTGSNSFGCLINGKVWLPNDNGERDAYRLLGGFSAPNDSTIGFDLTARNVLSNDLLSFYCKPIEGPGTYTSAQGKLKGLFILSDEQYSFVSGSLTVLRTDSIIAGTFEFLLVNGEDTAHITQGRFDIPWLISR